jgi:signal transduction histidine kinase
MRTVTARGYGRSVRLTRRAAGLEPVAVTDACLAITGIALTALAAWGHAGAIGTPIAGPGWLRAVLPLLLGVPLAVRRRAPLLMWTVLWASLSLQAVITRNAPAGLELLFILCAASYSLAAHASLRRALAGLAVMAPGAAIYVLTSHKMGSGILAIHGLGAGPWHLAGLIFVGEILACWLLGISVRARRHAASLAGRNAALQQQAQQAIAAERARIARELHDIVAHHLSVVVLQAAGARAAGSPAAGTLEKIEHSGRQALTEMRRLLGVLREPHEETGLTPQPGIGDLVALADSVCASGLPVHLVIDADHTGLPAAVSVSAYRIIQEALTNILKHAGPAHAEVAISSANDAVTIEVTDDGTGTPAGTAHPGGQGLAGMRERAAIFGGELAAGPRPGGGFAVRARLPLTSEPS